MSYDLINTELDTKVEECLTYITLSKLIDELMSATHYIMEPAKRLGYEEFFARIVVVDNVNLNSAILTKLFASNFIWRTARRENIGIIMSIDIGSVLLSPGSKK